MSGSRFFSGEGRRGVRVPMPFFGNFTLLIFKITYLEYTSGDGWTSLIHPPPPIRLLTF